jgi:hypothetical protein
MPGGEFSVRPHTLRSAGATYLVQSGALDGALARLRSTLAGLGDVCGDDEQGVAFAAAYKPAADTIQRGLSILVQGLASINEGLSAMADHYEGSDASSTFRGGPTGGG